MKRLIACLITIALVCLMSVVPVFAEVNLEGLKSSPGDVIIMGQIAVVNDNNVRLRADAGLSAPVLMYLQEGYIVEVAYDIPGTNARLYVDGMWWRKVTYRDGGVRQGYVAEQYLDFVG